ncbi:hypothetical protein MAR_034733 [Mya arenaria]|uniref:LAGLIDADG homing endonuclease n=1 Tax=Mya arenaria TaxID=6604 RepID=A0ABY7EKZ6_MYAAR|nr:hypothetical protein MAR_034733 [Mya arenaria]
MTTYLKLTGNLNQARNRLFKPNIRSPRKLFSLLIPRLGTRDNWIHFLEWFAQVNQDKTFQPYVAGNVVTMWFQAQGRADGEQSIYHIYHSWKFKEYTLYPNFKVNNI